MIKSKYLVAGLLCIQAILLGWGAIRHSPTYDEVAHLPAGLSHWELGDYRLFRVNPPLVRMVAALPVWLIGAETDWSRLEAAIASNSQQRVDFDVGRDFIAANGERAFWLYTFARWACVPFVSLGGWVIWRWSSQLYGERSGLIGVAIWTFSPMVLGHGQLITPDVAAGSLGALVFYLFWRWVNEPSWALAYGVGLSLGLTALTKSTWIIAPGLMMMLWMIAVVMQRRLKLEWIGQVAFLFAVSWLVFVLGYTGDGLFKPLGEYRFQSQSLRGDTQSDVLVDDGNQVVTEGNRFAESFLGRLPVPLPEQFILGVDVQKSNFESKTLSYLRGELRRGGWWYYYLYGVVVKSTVGVLVLLVGVTIVRLIGYRRLSLRERRPWRRWLDECFVLVPMLALLFVVSSQTGINKHLRYLLPAYPLAIIWISQIGRLIELSSGRFRQWVSVLTTGLLASSILSSLWIYPHSMSYFNEIAGGPRRGDDHLINSNIDWGQDLFFLKDKMKQRGWDRVGMVYWGRYDTRLAGINFDVPPEVSPGMADRQGSRSLILPEPGLYAISVNQLRGYGFVAPDGQGNLAKARPEGFRYFGRWNPIDTAGYSMRLFEITKDDIRLLRQEMGLTDQGVVSLVIRDSIPAGGNRRLSICPSTGTVGLYWAGYLDGSVSLQPGNKVSGASAADSSHTDRTLYRISTSGVCAIAGSPSGSFLVTGHLDGGVYLQPIMIGAEAISLGMHTQRINAIAVSPDGSRILTAGDDGRALIWDASKHELLATIVCEMPVTSAVWINDRQLAVGTGDWRLGRRGAIRTYSLDGQFVGEMEDSRHFINDLVVPSEGRVIGRSTSGDLAIWDTANGEKLRVFKADSPRVFALTSDRRWLVGGDGSGKVSIWDFENGDLVCQKNLFDRRIVGLAFLAGKADMVVMDDRGAVKRVEVLEHDGE